MPEKPKINYRQALQMRRSYIGKSCRLHFDVQPLKIVCGAKQYLYDDSGNEYLDCINNISHVGHCHPQVVAAGQEQMAKLATCNGFLSDLMSEYAKRLIETFPEGLCVCFFVNSGSEANDLALRLAKSYTKHEDVVCIDNSFHGNLDNLMCISPLRHKRIPNYKKPDWVHVAPCPDTYRGIYKDNPDAAQLYADALKRVVDAGLAKGRNVCAFMHEPIITGGGIITPPQGYMQEVYNYISSIGGVNIADEINIGAGRCGECMWSFQAHGVVPDIVTIGKPIGNGYPMAAVITRKEIADSLEQFNSGYGGNPVSCAMGIAVMDVIKNEKLMSSAKSVGRCLVDGFKAIQSNHPMLGDVRGMGLAVGVELVTDKVSRKPATEAADILAYRLKQEKIIAGNEGPDKNVLLFMPPMCFTVDNARRVVQAVDHALADIEKGALGTDVQPATQRSPEHVPFSVVIGENMAQDEEEEEEPSNKRMRYDELD